MVDGLLFTQQGERPLFIYVNHLQWMTDLQTIAMDLKSNLLATTMDLKTHAHIVAMRLDQVEKLGACKSLQEIQQIFTLYILRLIEMYRHL